MKTQKSIKQLLFSVLVVSSAFAACSNEGGKAKDDGHAHGSQDSTAAVVSVKPEFQDENLALVYDSYIQVKDAMVKTDAKETQRLAGSLQSALQKAGNSQGADLAGKIASSSDMAAQRAEFDALTTEMEKLLKASKLKSGTIYKQYCPMAYDGNGAYWLSSDSVVMNPYYGDEMLHCGEVKEEIK